MRGKKRRNYVSRKACFVNRFTLKAIHETGLLGYVVASIFSSHDIYSALLQRIEHCSTRKSTCRLPIYTYIYIKGFERLSEAILINLFGICIEVLLSFNLEKT